MSKITLQVERREETGKGPARRLRAAGKAPAIFYGRKTEPLKLAVNIHEFKKALEDAGSNPLFDLKIADAGSTVSRSALLKERQVRPFDGSLVHLDFQEVLMDESIEVTVPLEFEGKPLGLDKGGEFHIISRELKVSCLPGDIPNVITVDVSQLDVGQSIHAGDLVLPQGASAITEATVAVAAVALPKKEKEEEEAEAEAPEGE
ncbi:MAG TPA: 50S ribosomal protein L25 [Desulfomonilaceae bacterium]|nr:50S ribosomal protein L25 [Desulfomonilaceae bacterium]